jgi:cellobiose epimerase
VLHRTLVDELEDTTRMARVEGTVVLRRDHARTVKEDAHTISGTPGTAIVYRAPAPISGARLFLFAERARDPLALSVSADGRSFATAAARAEVVAAGDAATYGYWSPIAYRLASVPAGSRYLRIELRDGGVRLSRVEIEYGEEATVDRAALREAIESELRSDLLPFWRERAIDSERGGFIGEIASDGTRRPDAPRGLVLNARLLWSFAAGYRQLHDARDLALARRAYRYLEEHFRDRAHGGYHWRVSAEGAPLDETKKTYGQAFCIYALSEYALASGEAPALAAARALFDLVERHAHDEAHGGYWEARAADWSATTELRLGDGDPLAPKSMNTHLHVLEAYTTLYRAWPDARVAARLCELIDLFGAHIIAGDGRGGAHLRHFFDERWGVLSDTYTYGHDIEAAWLLREATEALGDAARQRAARDWAVQLASAALAEGVDADGALAYEGRGGAVIDAKRDWWCQGEAVVGFSEAHTLTGDERFAAAAARVWAFISSRMVDRVHGEWFWRVGADGLVDESLPKVSEWKCPYHTIRMALEMTRRLGGAADGGGR